MSSSVPPPNRRDYYVFVADAKIAYPQAGAPVTKNQSKASSVADLQLGAFVQGMHQIVGCKHDAPY